LTPVEYFSSNRFVFGDVNTSGAAVVWLLREWTKLNSDWSSLLAAFDARIAASAAATIAAAADVGVLPPLRVDLSDALVEVDSLEVVPVEVSLSLLPFLLWSAELLAESLFLLALALAASISFLALALETGESAPRGDPLWEAVLLSRRLGLGCFHDAT
jgi:hypothetical protein